MKTLMRGMSIAYGHVFCQKIYEENFHRIFLGKQ